MRAAAEITGSERFVVIGSRAVLGTHPDAPAELLNSREVDVFTFRSEQDAELIDGSIGEGSPFHRRFGYFAHGVGETTAVLPMGWKERLVAVRTPNTGGATGLCLELHDLAVAKLAAGREKDVGYVAGLLRHAMAHEATIRARLATTAMDAAAKERSVARLDRALAQVRAG